MASTKTVEYIAVLTDKITPVLTRIKGSSSKMEATMRRSFASIGNMAARAGAKIKASLSNAMNSVGGGLGGVLAGGALAMGLRSIIKTTGEFQQAQTTFNTLAGEKAGGQLFKELTDFANKTPFINSEVNKAGQTLLAFGANAKDIPNYISRLGDISAGNSERFQSLSLVFGQVQAAGRLMGQDLLQFVNAGFNPLLIISKKTGRSMLDLRNAMSKGEVSFDMVRDAIETATNAGGMFHGLMGKMSTTLPGLLSTLAGSFELVQVAIGEGLAPIIQPLVVWLTKMANSILANKEAFVRVALSIVATTAALTAMMLAFKAFTILSATNPFLLIASALVGIGVYLATIYATSKNIETLSTRFAALNGRILKTYHEQEGGVKALFSQLQYVQRGSQRHKDIVEQINTQYGHILGKNVTLNDNANSYLDAQNRILAVLLKQAQAEGIKARYSELWAARESKVYETRQKASQLGLSLEGEETGKGLTKYLEYLKSRKAGKEGFGAKVDDFFGLADVGQQMELKKIFGKDFNFDQVKKIGELALLHGNNQLDKKELAHLQGAMADLIDVPTAPTTTTTLKEAALSKKAKEVKEEIVSAGGLKQFNINIAQLTGVNTLTTSTFKESTQSIGEAVTQTILRAIAEVNPSMA